MKDPKTLVGSCKTQATERRDEMLKDIVEEIFKCSGANGKKILENAKWNDFWEGDGSEKRKLEMLGHFYYFICKPYIKDKGVGDYDWEEDYVNDEIRMIGTISLIEKMMEEEDHKDFINWVESRYPSEAKKGTILNFHSKKEEYLSHFGTNRKVRRYFEKFLNKKDQDTLKRTIRVYDDKSKEFKEMDSVAAIADFLYKLRSQFVHSSRMIGLCPPNVDWACRGLGNKFYDIRLTMGDFLLIFQQSFTSYWEEKIFD